MLTSPLDSHQQTECVHASQDNNTITINSLTTIINEIELSLQDNTWLNKKFTLIDKSLMPMLVDVANKKKPGLNLSYLNSPYQLPDEIEKQPLISETKPQKYIISCGEDKAHFALLDIRFIDDKLSMILFEPSPLKNYASSLLAFRLECALNS